jgi:hypothetical protein
MGSQETRQVLGVTLSPLARAILNQVEEGFGRPIRVAYASEAELGPGVEAASYVDDDGTPAIQGIASDIEEGDIVHELLHLKLKLEGYPARWQLSPPYWSPLSPSNHSFDVINRRPSSRIREGNSSPSTLAQHFLNLG